MPETVTQTTNDNLIEIIEKVQSLKTLFSDNREFIHTLLNVEQEDTGTNFEKYSKKILQFKIPHTIINNNPSYLFSTLSVSGSITRKSVYQQYKKALVSIKVAINVIYHIIKENENTKAYITKYKNIKSVEFVKFTEIQGNTKKVDVTFSKSGIPTITTNISYILDDDGKLTIANNDANISLTELSSFQKFGYQFVTSEDASGADIVKNYLYFMLSFNTYNLRRQVYAFYFFIDILYESFKFYDNAEQLIYNTSYSPDCTSLFNADTSVNFLAHMNKLDTYLSNGIQSASPASTTYNEMKGHVTDICPVRIKFDDITYNYDKRTHSNQIQPDEYEKYEVKISGGNLPIEKIYDIENIDYIQYSSSSNIVNAIEIKAIGIENNYRKQCNDESFDSYPTINLKQDNTDNINATIVAKSSDNIKEDIYNTGTVLNTLNESIQKSKDKINTQVKIFDAQNSILKSLDTRQNIYYVVFSIISVLIIVLLFIDTQQSLKLYASLIFALVLLAINVVNYYLKYDYIEPFTEQSIVVCSQINSNTSVDAKIRFVQQHIALLSAEIGTLYGKIKDYIDKLDTIDVYAKLSGSLKNEQKNFEEHASKFKQREDVNKKSIDIMKHEMINKTGFMNLLSISFFVLVVVYTLYVISPEYIMTYLVIGFILLLVNLSVYYIVILHPVRTKARNKYWTSPSNSTLMSIS